MDDLRKTLFLIYLTSFTRLDKIDIKKIPYGLQLLL